MRHAKRADHVDVDLLRLLRERMPRRDVEEVHHACVVDEQVGAAACVHGDEQLCRRRRRR